MPPTPTTLLVTDAVDPRLVVSDVSAPAGVDCSASAGQLVSCSKEHLASGGSFTITVTYDVASTVDSDASVSNTAHVASDEDAAQDTDSVAITEDVDLEITKTFADDEVTAGDASTHTFDLVVENLGDSDADNVTIVDTAPAGLTFLSEDSANCSITLAGNLSCTFAHLAANSLTTITVTYDVDSTVDAGEITNSATVSSDEDTDTASDSVAVIEDVDLEITKTFADDEVTAGDASTHTFDLVVENLGDSDADNVTIVDTAPAGLTFLSEDSANCSITLAGNLSCTFAHLAANSSTTITVTYDVDSTVDAGEITNSATVTSDEDTDTASDTVAIVEDVQLTMDKSFTDDSVTAGGAGTHTFTLVVTNDGASDADNVLVTDAVDPRLVVSNVSAPAGVDCSASAGQSVSCSKDHLASGGSFTITVTYDVDSTEDSDPSVLQHRTRGLRRGCRPGHRHRGDHGRRRAGRHQDLHAGLRGRRLGQPHLHDRGRQRRGLGSRRGRRDRHRGLRPHPRVGGARSQLRQHPRDPRGR